MMRVRRAAWGIGLTAATAAVVAGCSSEQTVRPLSPTYTATISVEAAGDHPEPASWILPDSVDVTIRIVDSTAVPPDPIAAGDIFAVVGAQSVRLPLLADRTTYSGRAPRPGTGQAIRLVASGARGLVDSFSVTLTIPDAPIITEPVPDSSIFPAKALTVSWGMMRTDDAAEVVLRSLDFPETDSVVTRPSLDDGFLRIEALDVARIPPGVASIRVTRSRRSTFAASGLRAGSATAAASMSERVYVLAPESPRRTWPGRRAGARAQ